MKKILLATVTLATLLGSAAPSFAATAPIFHEDGYTLTKTTISVSGKTTYTPYTLVAKDPNSGVMTTFVPIWYVMQVLSQNGLAATWDGAGKGMLTIWDGGFGKGFGIFNSKGSASVMLNGKQAETGVPRLTVKDPESGVYTTYFPIYYINQLLTALKYNVTWNGSTHRWAMTPPQLYTPGTGTNTNPSTPPTTSTGTGTTSTSGGSSASPIAGVPAPIQGTWEQATRPQTIGDPNEIALGYGGNVTYSFTPNGLSPTAANLQLADQQAQDVVTESNVQSLSNPQYCGLLSTYGMLSTSTQWYNDPSNAFYDKQFPVADMKDGFVIQKDPYVVVMTDTGLLTASGTPEYLIGQYLGYGSNSSQGQVTVWKEEWVNSKTGVVMSIPNYAGIMLPALDKGANRPHLGLGTYFGTNVNGVYNPWNVGTGLDVVPILSWKPNIG